MPSTFTWLDYSEKERRRALDVISLFKIKETRDELGLASIRDAFADHLFPGTSTIQTRARYFLLVPWVCLRLERRQTSSAQFAHRLRREEEALIAHLADDEDATGVIGRRSGRAVKRLPSSIYWAGLQRWGILIFRGSLAVYQRSLDRYYPRVRGRRLVAESDGERGPEPGNWHAYIPPAPDGFPEDATLSLELHEAHYLRERVLSTCTGSLLAHLLDRCEAWDPVDFAWSHEAVAELPPSMAELLSHAQRFSEVMHGAAWLYNIMLAEAKHKDEWRATYIDQFDSWSNRTASSPELAEWNIEQFWATVSTLSARVTVSTRSFVAHWIDYVRSAQHAKKLLSEPTARGLIRQREAQLKKGRARLASAQHLDLWEGDSGTGQLDFRWAVSQRLMLDIVHGLAGDGAEASQDASG